MKTSLIIVLILLLLCAGAQAEGMDPAETGAAAVMSGSPVTVTSEITALLTSDDWMLDGSTLRFHADGSITDPTGGEPLFSSYAVTGRETVSEYRDIRQPDGGRIPDGRRGRSCVRSADQRIRAFIADAGHSDRQHPDAYAHRHCPVFRCDHTLADARQL